MGLRIPFNINSAAAFPLVYFEKPVTTCVINGLPAWSLVTINLEKVTRKEIRCLSNGAWMSEIKRILCCVLQGILDTLIKLLGMKLWTCNIHVLLCLFSIVSRFCNVYHYIYIFYKNITYNYILKQFTLKRKIPYIKMCFINKAFKID